MKAVAPVLPVAVQSPALPAGEPSPVALDVPLSEELLALIGKHASSLSREVRVGLELIQEATGITAPAALRAPVARAPGYSLEAAFATLNVPLSSEELVMVSKVSARLARVFPGAEEDSGGRLGGVAGSPQGRS
ncbi:hypothetical protein LPB260_19475 [Pseudomonas sp. LPB0260]|uniref:hypothetical protein n=1 Tax=Pseudomonas sp. LPB0260 TaxID=2614442 RepID=UPI0015C2A4F8|nr:hypothetical protein [Pseudomonas sp. LPB0260]QLC72936.1 hypothetical protein LPB260_04525 [Pseudomonas sp. LPB0260]QLC75710.1 hypothetical protein LPB260_19475 [Pseudomonas sp. LPB0260]